LKGVFRIGYRVGLIRKLDNSMVQRNYLQVKKDIRNIKNAEMERLVNDPALVHLGIKKM
jgi:hypothetical protein